MHEKIWRTAPPDREGRAALERAGIHPLMAAVLCARGLRTAQQAREFLSHALPPLWDSGQMKDMDRAAERLRRALDQKETIAVYGDYDVDGITATCLLTEFLRDQGGRVIPYIPDRMEEGYGLNRDAVSALAAQGVKLIVTVDCGITAVDEVAWASGLGVDVVITDHHECKAVIPDACAVVDPHRPDCGYPFKGLAGVGVALKLAMALAGPERTRQVLEDYADLAAVGTVADVMPMVDENRAIVRLGLAALAQPRRLGLAALVRQAGLESRPLTSVSIGYTLAPRINAAGRMGCAGLAVELLLTRDAARAEELAARLCALNRERQTVEMGIFEQCVQRLRGQDKPRAIVLADPGWHQGVVGIVASRLAEQFGCPAFMICLAGGIGKGSCRSYAGINLFAVLEGCQDLLEAFGGHELAAGFTVKEENIPALTRRIQEQVDLQARTVRTPELDIDAELDDPAILDLEGVEQLDRLEPYGTGNPRPVLAVTGAQVMSRALVGGGRHLKLKLAKHGIGLDAIYFSSGDCMPEVGSRVDVAFYPQINEYRGVRTVQMQVVDLRQAPSRSRMEQESYESYRQGRPLTPAQARVLLPQREEFAALWRYLKRNCPPDGRLEDTPLHLARSVARWAGQRETVARTLVCLDVMQERGLLTVHLAADRLSIRLNPVDGKVDLEASRIMVHLRGSADAPP